jgi:hypothetical protein
MQAGPISIVPNQVRPVLGVSHLPSIMAKAEHDHGQLATVRLSLSRAWRLGRP